MTMKRQSAGAAGGGVVAEYLDRERERAGGGSHPSAHSATQREREGEGKGGIENVGVRQPSHLITQRSLLPIFGHSLPFLLTNYEFITFNGCNQCISTLSL